MFNPRRFYIYLVSAISVQAITWAVIALLRNLFISDLDPDVVATAFQIAVIVIGLPVYLIHWLWGQRLARSLGEERTAFLRVFYLYGIFAGFLAPILANTFYLFANALAGLFGDRIRNFDPELASGDRLIYHLLALVVLALISYYHYRVLADEVSEAAETGLNAAVRRLFFFGFSAAGLILSTLGVIGLFRWVLLQIGRPSAAVGSQIPILSAEVIRLILGIMVWLIFWVLAQRLFDGPNPEERQSALRKVYLYAAIFIGAISVVGNTTAILTGVFRRVLDLPSQGDIRILLPAIVGLGVVWGYHAIVLRADEGQIEETTRQAGIRRLYQYLIGAIGLAALLIGISGVISVLIRSLDAGFGTGLREQLALFAAATIVGLPVWLLPWRSVQAKALEAGAAGADSRASLVRKIYLYFFIFAATMTALSSAVYIVFKVVGAFLGEAPPTISELGQPIAFILIAVAVWVYHGGILRRDGALTLSEQVARFEKIKLAIVDIGGGTFGQALAAELKHELPGVEADPITLIPPQDGVSGLDEKTITQLKGAGLIIGPWTLAVAGAEDGAVTAEIAAAVNDNLGFKLFQPTWAPGRSWIGVEQGDQNATVRQAVQAVKQILEGLEVKPARNLGVGSIIGIIFGVLIVLSIMASIAAEFFGF
jgi:hypothetical protein